MSNTITIRLPEEVIRRLREKSRRTGLPVNRVVRQAVEDSLIEGAEPAWKKYVGIVKGGPRNLSSRKGFSRE